MENTPELNLSEPIEAAGGLTVLDIIFTITCVMTALWLAWTVFVWWRRSASNLTSVSASSPNKKAQPDFLKVDQKARSEAIARGEAFDKELDKRDIEEAREEKRLSRRRETGFARIARLIALLMSLFTLATAISGVIFQVSFMGDLWQRYSATERLTALITEHPIGVVVTIGVIGYHVVVFVTQRKWEES